MFDIHQPPLDEHGEWCDELAEEYVDDLISAFAESPEGVAVDERHDDLQWAYVFSDFALTYIGTTPPKMTPGHLHEILFDLIPRKVSVDADEAGEIVSELRAFWEFLGRQFGLQNAAEILNELGTDAVDSLGRELSDPSNFGMAKAFVMSGREAGFDMSSEEGFAAFTAVYNQALRGAYEPDAAGTPGHRRPAGENTVPATPRLSAEQRKQQRKQRNKKLKKKKRPGR